jgi:hypothetical protein
MHYSIERWADFARGIVQGREAAEMQAHLSAGCAPCNRTASLFSRVAAVTKGRELSVPQYIVHQATSIMALAGRGSESVATKLAKLVFDSFLQPLPAGVRSTAQLCQQALFEAENILVDVRVEREGENVMLTGQVSDRQAPTRSAADLTVTIDGAEGRREIRTNSYGEFQTVFHPESDSTLWITGPEGSQIVIPVFQLASCRQGRTQA